MTVLDAHVHVWDPAALPYPWLREAPALDRPMLPGDVDRAGGEIRGAVFVEADCRPERALDEARWVAALPWPDLRGIVAAADLRSPSLAEHLDALGEVVAAGGARVVGVRQLLQGEDAAAWADDDVLAAGLEAVAARGATFDACVRWTQLDALAPLLARAPGLRAVVDHLGKPPVDDGVDDDAGRAWRRALARVAALPQTAVKLSGLGAEASDPATLARSGDAFTAAALDLFGPDRALYGSDWPVSARVGAAAPASDGIARVRRVAGSDADAVLRGTAAAFYRLASAA